METEARISSAIHARGAILLISCYELGHRPVGLTRPLRALEVAGFAPDVIDIAVESLDVEKVSRAQFIGISVPMHTALRLGVHLLHRIREINADVSICMYGLYATLNADYLLSHGVDYCVSNTASAELVELVKSLIKKERTEVNEAGFPATKLPPLEVYAQFEDNNGEVRTVGYTETTHGCKHLCTHCPIPPIYNGKFFVVQRDTVLAEIQEQVVHKVLRILRSATPIFSTDRCTGFAFSVQCMRLIRTSPLILRRRLSIS